MVQKFVNCIAVQILENELQYKPLRTSRKLNLMITMISQELDLFSKFNRLSYNDVKCGFEMLH